MTSLSPSQRWSSTARDGCQPGVAQIWCELARGELELSEGRSAQAAERLTLLVTRLDELGVGDANLDPGPDLVDALLRVGEVEAATRAARRYASVAGPDARPWTVARVQRALGLVAPDEACDAPFALALVSHARTRDTFEAARTRLA
ncbi:hypothetical protein [Janibacter terrae]|uniref:hypothetical protein n=1 Tax=Janibacter terrae TaxID=103817 RepID=UPI000829EB4C|nr:hypothetical protein [Janibacter terrae]